MSSPAALQPAIHHLVSCIHAPSATMSGPDGQIRPDGAMGFFLGERRLLSAYALLVFGRAPELVHSALGSDGALRITAILRDGTEDTPDPVLLLRHERRPHASGFTDTLSIHNFSSRARNVPVALTVAADLAATSAVKVGLRPPIPLAARCAPGGIAFESDGYSIGLTAVPDATVDLATTTLSWNIDLEAGATWDATVDVHGDQPDDGAFRPAAASLIPWSAPTVSTSDDDLATLVDWSFADLRRLALADPLAPDDTFIAAGCPWYFTLFGRDALWTARMLCPFGTGIAASTLRALARRQGTQHDSHSAEQPGRILHEIRPATLIEGPMELPPVYYGTVDATHLWITTLAEAWRWGLDEGEVEAMLGPLQAAVGWLLDCSDPDDDGLCEYIDADGTGLSNQGWKDSGDAVNWHDGALAVAPIALVEVQGYAYEAALNAIQLYDHFGLAGTERIARFAERLRTAFHRKFWITDEAGARLAIALDADKRAVDSVTSNPGHVLGTGLLTSEQEAAVVDRLVADLDCGVGLRTMSNRDSRYNPLSYHNGSIWPHDTAICARGMVLAGHPDAAGRLISGLLTITTWFDGRLPELFASIDDLAPIVPYPASCRPQAWAAAVGPLALWAAAPLVPSEPGTAPRRLAGIDRFAVLDIDGFQLAGKTVRAEVRTGSINYPDLDP